MASNPISTYRSALERVSNVRLIHPAQGHSVRRVLPGSGATSVFSTPSIRFREGHAVEGRTATLLEKHDEVAAEVLDSRPEPLTVVGVVDGVERRATPDRARLLIDGTRQLCECKHDWASFYKPDAIIQRLLTEAAAAALGWEYLPIVPASLGSRTFQKNVDRIYGARCVHVHERVAIAATRLLASGPLPLGELTASLHDSHVNGFSMACALMVRRVIEIELDAPIGDRSMVQIMPRPSQGLPSIRFRRRGS